jgi:hypothetical protein
MSVKEGIDGSRKISQRQQFNMANVNPILRNMINEESSLSDKHSTVATDSYNHKMEIIKLRQKTELSAYLRCCYLRIMPRNTKVFSSVMHDQASTFMQRMRPFY